MRVLLAAVFKPSSLSKAVYNLREEFFKWVDYEGKEFASLVEPNSCKIKNLYLHSGWRTFGLRYDITTGCDGHFRTTVELFERLLIYTKCLLKKRYWLFNAFENLCIYKGGQSF